jgi:hypothetical protein
VADQLHAKKTAAEPHHPREEIASVIKWAEQVGYADVADVPAIAAFLILLMIAANAASQFHRRR